MLVQLSKDQTRLEHVRPADWLSFNQTQSSEAERERWFSQYPNIVEMGLVTLNVCWSIIGWHALNSLKLTPFYNRVCCWTFFMTLVLGGSFTFTFLDDGWNSTWVRPRRGCPKILWFNIMLHECFFDSNCCFAASPTWRQIDKATCVTYFSAGHISH